MEKPPEHGYAPDPPPLSDRALWVYQVTYDHGQLRVAPPQLECRKQPLASARRIGRFAFELWLGPELIERIRFDFPLLAAEEPRPGRRQPLREAPRFGPGARVPVTLRVPAGSRANRANILDRATGQMTAVAWPPLPAPAGGLCPSPEAAPTSAY